MTQQVMKLITDVIVLLFPLFYHFFCFIFYVLIPVSCLLKVKSAYGPSGSSVLELIPVSVA